MEKLYKVKGFKNIYVTEKSEIFSLDKNGFLKQRKPPKTINGYPVISGKDEKGKNKTRVIHRVLMETIYPRPDMDELVVNHKNYDKGDFTLTNLEWVTRERNAKHFYESLGYEYDEKGNCVKKADHSKAASISWKYDRKKYLESLRIK